MNIFTNIFGGAKSAHRTFAIYKIHNEKYAKINGGRYKNNNPQDAARKAFRKVLEKNTQSHISFQVEMRETTRGSAHKIYKYIFTRVLKSNPLKIKKNQEEVIYKYKIYNKYIAPKKNPVPTPQPKQSVKPVTKKSGRYKCTKEEKEDPLTGATCCSKFNTVNKRSYESCKKHIQRIRK